LPGSFTRRDRALGQRPWIVAFCAALIGFGVLIFLVADTLIVSQNQLVAPAASGLLAVLCLIGSMWWIAARNAERQRDVTQALRESERRFRLFINGVTDYAIYMLDPEGRVTQWNCGAERIEGYSEKEIVGHSFKCFYTEADRINGLPDYVLEQARKWGRHESEGWRVRKDGRRFWANVVLEAIRDEYGELMGFAKITRDATERRKMLRDLRAEKQRAERAAAAKSEFLANMSHEIRTPLNGILGYARLALENDGVSEKARTYLKRVMEASNVLRVVIDDILDFSRIEAGELGFELKPFSTREFVDNCVGIIEPMADEKKLELRAEIDRNVPDWVWGDASRLRQVLLNLLNNAVKFTQHGHVEVTLERASSAVGEGLRFAVSDTGIGVPAEKIGKLFSRFSQADSSMSRKYGGSGLGLAICKRIVDAMGGAIGVESTEGAGSTFWFKVPLRAAEKPAEEPARAASPSRKLDILVVDDLDMNRDLVKLVLENAGHSVTTANDGAEAIERAKAKPYDLILMDIQMPGIDGVEATGRIRALGGRHRSVPIIALTANVMPEQVRSYKKAGLTDHIGKPITFERLLGVVERFADTEPARMAG
jgi:PAS domain S-box-containing protein